MHGINSIRRVFKSMIRVIAGLIRVINDIVPFFKIMNRLMNCIIG